jgi:hypothetical protein
VVGEDVAAGLGEREGAIKVEFPGGNVGGELEVFGDYATGFADDADSLGTDTYTRGAFRLKRAGSSVRVGERSESVVDA